MSLPGDENPNPQWQRPSGSGWQSGDPFGGGDAPREEPPRWQSEWQRAPDTEQPWQSDPQYANWQAPGRTPGQAVASLILGIVGLMFCPLIGSILALAFGYQAKGQIDASGGQLGGRGVALAGIILGWVSLVLWGLFFALVLIGALASS
jgi:hypothetical protein